VSEEPLSVTLPVLAVKVAPAAFVKAASLKSRLPEPLFTVAPEAFVQAPVEVTEAAWMRMVPPELFATAAVVEATEAPRLTVPVLVKVPCRRMLPPVEAKTPEFT
jgi:hypothetical protein